MTATKHYYWYCSTCKCEPAIGTIGVNRRDEEYHTVCNTGLELYGRPTIGQALTSEMTAAEMYGFAICGLFILAICLTVIFGVDYPMPSEVAK